MLVSSELRAEQCCDSYITQEGGGRLLIKKYLYETNRPHTQHTQALSSTLI